MTYPWKGAARPMPAHAFAQAAEAIGCEVAAIRAVFAVESASRGYLRDGSLVRRFEPHKMPGAKTNWRDSKKIGPKRREEMFCTAYAKNPDAALMASSWGGPQIMGFNHAAAGFNSAEGMVTKMADAEIHHVQAFVALILDWGLDSAIRAHDWATFERHYNGGGFNGAYAVKIEKAYRKASGRASPTVLRLGDAGAAVRELQGVLGIVVDGSFGGETDAAVRAFQGRAGLPVDGVVGRRTWSALEAQRDAKPKVQKTGADKVIDRGIDILIKGGGGAVLGDVVTGALDRAPTGAVDLFFYGMVILGLGLGGLLAVRYLRRAA